MGQASGEDRSDELQSGALGIAIIYMKILFSYFIFLISFFIVYNCICIIMYHVSRIYLEDRSPVVSAFSGCKSCFQESLRQIKQSPWALNVFSPCRGSPQAVDLGLERLAVPRGERLLSLLSALPPLLLLLSPHGEIAERVVASSGAAALTLGLTVLQAERTCCQAERTQASCKRAASLCEAFANRAEQQGGATTGRSM